MTRSDFSTKSDDIRYRAVFELGIPSDTSCPLFTQLEDTPESVSLNYHNGDCYIDVELDSDRSDGKRRFMRSVDNCSCPAFWKHGCFPRVLSVEDWIAVSETYFSDRETLQKLVADIRDTGRPVTLRKLTAVDGDSEISEPLLFDAARLTDRERAAVERAVARGYYNRPREVNLQDLADEFGISNQAMSARLQSVESKMANDLFAASE